MAGTVRPARERAYQAKCEAQSEASENPRINRKRGLTIYTIAEGCALVVKDGFDFSQIVDSREDGAFLAFALGGIASEIEAAVTNT
jgi:hypothetical protein